MSLHHDPCPHKPCKHCQFGRPVSWKGTNFEWCQFHKSCAASIDWEALAADREAGYCIHEKAARATAEPVEPDTRLSVGDKVEIVGAPRAAYGRRGVIGRRGRVEHVHGDGVAAVRDEAGDLWNYSPIFLRKT